MGRQYAHSGAEKSPRKNLIISAAIWGKNVSHETFKTQNGARWPTGMTGRKENAMTRAKGLTYEEFIALAKENYNKGGDVAVECWDQKTFETYVEMFGPVTKTEARQMFREWLSEEREQHAMMFGEW